MSSGSRTTIRLMLLAGDIGATKTLMGVFSRERPRPSPIHTATFRTLDFADLTSLSREFLKQAGVSAGQLTGACFGVAGPVKNRRAQLTNVPWDVDADAIGEELGVARTGLLNDLEAM